jgi:hypothetical protein
VKLPTNNKQQKLNVNENHPNLCPSDSQESQLQQAAIGAKNSPPNSLERQQALNQLIDLIWHSQQLGHPQRGLWSESLYREFYGEALQKTLLEVCLKIDAYNPEHSVMAWVNFRLKKQFIEVVRDYHKKGLTYSPRQSQTSVVTLASLDDLDRYLQVENDVSEVQRLQEFLETDPEGKFGAERIRGYPHLTFQRLAKSRLIEEKSWETIAQEYQISLQTLCSFFHRRLKKLIPYFRKYLDSE